MCVQHEGDKRGHSTPLLLLRLLVSCGGNSPEEAMREDTLVLSVVNVGAEEVSRGVSRGLAE